MEASRLEVGPKPTGAMRSELLHESWAGGKMESKKRVDSRRGGGRSRAPSTRRSRNGGGDPGRGPRTEYGVGGTGLTLNAAVVEAAAPRPADVAKAAGPNRRQEEGRRRWLTPNAVVIEAAPPRKERRSRTGDGGPSREEVKDEIRSQRAELTPNAAVVEAASPHRKAKAGRAEEKGRRSRLTGKAETK